MPYMPNMLNSVQTYTYRIRIFMLRDMDANFASYSRTGTLVLDSASTSQYNIKSLEQVHTLGFSNARHALAHSFTLQIAESDGSTFYEYLSGIASSLGINNLLVNAKYVIEITFPGRFGNQERTTATYAVPICFNTMNATITSTGTVYDISAVEVSTRALSYLSGVIKTSISFVGDTVGETIKDLELKINEAAAINAEADNNYLFRNEYEIKFHENASEWADWPIQFSEIPTPEDVNGKKQFVLNAGTSLFDYIGTILSTTAEYKSYPVAQGGYCAPNGGNAQNFDLKVLYKIISTEEDIRFDPLAGKYAKKITYTIKKHITPDCIVDSGEISAFQGDSSRQTRRVRQLLGSGLLKKRYDYLNTGKNTEVINLDIKLENTYYLISPSMGGQVSTARLANRTQTSDRLVEAEQDNQRRQFISGQYNELNRRNPDGSFSINNQTVRRSIEESISTAVGNLNIIRPSNGMYYVYNPDIIDNSNLYNPRSDLDTTSVMRFGASMQNLTSSGDMQEIEMQIRGDPYWLGRPSEPYQIDLNGDAADYESGANYFYLKINLPNNGNPTSEFTISGIYRVINVISEYRNGKFIQYLKAYKDMMVNTREVSDAIESGQGESFTLGRNSPLDGSGGITQNSNAASTNRNGQNGTGDGYDGTSPTGTEPATPADQTYTGDHQLDSRVDPRLNELLAQTGNETGIEVRTSSGYREIVRTNSQGQPVDTAGSTSQRHQGDASDVALYYNGTRLNVNNPDHAALIQRYTQTFYNNAREAGITPNIGIGTNYMSGTAFHYDISTRGGLYWGNGSDAGGAVPWLPRIYGQ